MFDFEDAKLGKSKAREENRKNDEAKTAADSVTRLLSFVSFFS